MYMWATFGEIAGTNIEIDLTLRKYMYDVFYINQNAIQVQYIDGIGLCCLYFRRIAILPHLYLII